MNNRILFACVGLLALVPCAYAAPSNAAAITQTCGKGFAANLPKATKAYRIGGMVNDTSFRFELPETSTTQVLPMPTDDDVDFSLRVAAGQTNLVAVVTSGTIAVYGPAPENFANDAPQDNAGTCTLYTKGNVIP